MDLDRILRPVAIKILYQGEVTTRVLHNGAASETMYKNRNIILYQSNGCLKDAEEFFITSKMLPLNPNPHHSLGYLKRFISTHCLNLESHFLHIPSCNFNHSMLNISFKCNS